MGTSRWPVASSDADFAPYLAGAPEASAAMFARFLGLARAAGPVTFELQRGVIVLRGTRRIFASVRITCAGLAGHINLTRQVTDPRLGKTEPLTKTLIYHAYRVTSLSELDQVFAEWLAEAQAVGDGQRLPLAPGGGQAR
jgi:hypothetical protein